MQGQSQLAHGTVISDTSKLPDKPGLPGNSAGDIVKPISEQRGKRNGERTGPLCNFCIFLAC